MKKRKKKKGEKLGREEIKRIKGKRGGKMELNRRRIEKREREGRKEKIR